MYSSGINRYLETHPKADCAFWTVGTLLVLGTLIAVIDMNTRDIWPRLLSRDSWVPVEATIVHTDVVPRSSRHGTSYEPVIRYRYIVDNQTYLCQDIRLMKEPTRKGSQSWANDFVNDYPLGSTHTVYTNPKSPEMAAIYTELNGHALTWAIGVPLFFSAVTLAIGAAAFYRWKDLLSSDSSTNESIEPKV